MKKPLAVLALLMSAPAFAQSDAFISFYIPGGLNATNGVYDALMLDLNFQSNTISVNGTIEQSNGLSAPATGTCFITSEGGAYCNLQVDHLSINVSLNKALSGTVSLKDALGNIIDQSPIFVI